MKKSIFDLTGKAIDCRELSEMGDAGKEIFRALKVACNGLNEAGFGSFYTLGSESLKYRFLVVGEAGWFMFSEPVLKSVLTPIDALGQARIDAAKDGARLVFEGDVVPRHLNVIFYDDGTKFHGCDRAEYIVKPDYPVIAYKPLEEKQPSIESRVRVKSATYFNRTLTEAEMIERTQPSIESRILAEKVGTKHSHYFKDISDLDEIDVYRVCDLFEVHDPSGAKQHAIKKLLCSGQRGAKDERKDLEEARDTIIRKLAMMAEDKE